MYHSTFLPAHTHNPRPGKKEAKKRPPHQKMDDGPPCSNDVGSSGRPCPGAGAGWAGAFDGAIDDDVYDDDDGDDGAPADGTATRSSYPSFYSCVAPTEGELAYAAAAVAAGRDGDGDGDGDGDARPAICARRVRAATRPRGVGGAGVVG